MRAGFVVFEVGRDLGLALSTEQNHFFTILIAGPLFRPQDHVISLLQGCRRFHLAHECVFTVKSITDGTSHKGSFIIAHFRHVVRTNFPIGL
jgi:hypothetical protein